MRRDEFSENLDDVTDGKQPGGIFSPLRALFNLAVPGAVAVDAGAAFDDARDEAAQREAQAKHREQIFKNQQDGEALKNGVATLAQVSNNFARSMGQATLMRKEQVEKARQRMSDVLFLALLENRLEAQYGKNFAENMLSDLHEQGLVEDEAYKRIMAIEDQSERRQAIAGLIQEGLDSGAISESDLKGHPWAGEWVASRARAQAEVDNDAQLAVQGKKSLDEISADANNEAGKGYIGNDATKARGAENSNEAAADKKGEEVEVGGVLLGSRPQI